MGKLFAATLLLSMPFYAAVSQAPTAGQKTVTEKLAKLVEPWPNAEVLNARRSDAERRTLFQSSEPLAFTLESGFSALNKDRDPNSTKEFPAVLKVTGSDGQPKSIELAISGRGHLRRTSAVCSFIPIRLMFRRDSIRGTPFEGPSNNLKLVTHCQSSREHEQYILREHLVYKLSNIVLERSFRTRLATVTYVDSKTGKPVTTRAGMLLEDDDDVARRMGGRIIDLERLVFTDIDLDPLLKMMVFEFMIGNTDFSIFALHNVVLIQTPDKKMYPVPYDFDLSALVHAPYAIPDKRLNMKSITDRLYRGPCRTREELDAVFATFKEKRDAIFATVDSIAGLDSTHRREVSNYLKDFFSLIERPASVKRFFIDTCNKTAM